MRIISGRLKSIVIHPPKGLPVRPTTDRAKESLFSILENRFDWPGTNVLDLFSGTGNMAYEYCSRGAMAVTAVDLNAKCVAFIKEMKEKHALEQLKVVKKDAFGFLNATEGAFDIIFADAPYALPGIARIPGIVTGRRLLNHGGWLIIEHQSHLDLSHESGYFDKRSYGQSAFSFFQYPE